MSASHIPADPNGDPRDPGCVKHAADAHAQPLNANDDEEDYMSARFLEQADVIDRLSKDGDIQSIGTYQQRRRRQLRLAEAKQQENRVLPRKVLEERQRAVGLGTHLPPDHIGYRLLQRMGWQPNNPPASRETADVGPSNNSRASSAILTTADVAGLTVPVSVPRGHAGLGYADPKPLKPRSPDLTEKQANITDQDLQSYRDRQRERKHWERLRRDMERVTQLLADLGDTVPSGEGDTASSETGSLSESEEASATTDADTWTESELERRVLLLRQRHHYCYWCGGRPFDTATELDQHCPGPDRDAHSDLL